MSQDIDVQGELTNRLKAYFTSTLRAKMRWNPGTEIVSVDTSGVTYKLVAIDYENLKQPIVKPRALVSREFRNDSNATIHSTFQQSEQNTDSFSWSITAGLKLGASAKYKAGVPFIGQAEVTLSAELTVAAGKTNTVTHANTWSESVTLDIPAKNAIKASIMLNEAHVDTPFTATFLAQGQVKCVLNIPDQQFFATLDGGIDWPTRPDLNHLPVLADAKARQFQANGTFTGSAGLSTFVTTEELVGRAPAGV
jgi:hypothetical protein